ncbi:glycosyl transferase family protein [Rhodoblastus acidophilus]|uniref:Glycosyl transferase family protein n=1 Tax=Candidatus Rhodoblastus alkanivorans TaxID=2954117 RepID=A0ABS9ZAJ9_9HYPH|nr:glycosyl transferase family protein [Candidatus Rhodoblastus alkanivorans]MCI4680688.1 glycosyl transferase family protein [Candidatus Rhodoblastus alkanivorans]MCI4684375.1 glycosyl transferase family protein [Candidatus Rhodoblastus alkanivorans]MDI4641696.1 glycosyl transferase family protein [Rhodoblastus acidophilus]
MLQTPHPFARFIAILGRGRNLSRALTVEEAEEAMTMILAGDVLPEQLGAFLMLLRIKEESPSELAGFVKAVRKTLPAPEPGLVAVDWSSYAGKKRQLLWFLLAALSLVQAGHSVFMHGFDGHTPGRLYTGEVLTELGLAVAPDFPTATRALRQSGFAYMDLSAISAPLARMMGFKPILGLRSPIHTLARMINPFGAPVLPQGIFHPNYMTTHRDAALLLGEDNMVVFRGEGGEIERRPGKPCETLGVRDGVAFEERWPPIMEEPRQLPDEAMDVSRLLSVWRGDAHDAYAEAAVTGTLALILRAMKLATDMESAQSRAEAMWRGRDPGRLLAA